MDANKNPKTNPLRNERGSVLIMIALSVVALFSFAVVAIDGPIMMTTKGQLQAAADAAALAGASGLPSSQGEARRRARLFAQYNYAVRDSLERVVITDADIDLSVADRVRVTTHRTTATNDALRTYFLRVLDLAAGQPPSRANRVDVSAVATAEIRDNCAASCVKPWAIPDRWDDSDGNGVCDWPEPFVDADGNGTWDAGETFTDDDGDGVWDAGNYYDPDATGYLAPGDVGTQLVLHSDSTPGPVAPGQYYSIDLPPLGKGIGPFTGGAAYRDWIATCCPYVVAPGDSCQLEPGQMVGPTVQGVAALIAQDPGAHWNSSTQQVEDSLFGQSPRVALIPFYDPRLPPISGRPNVKITKIAAFFLESVGPGSRVTGRFLQVTAPGLPCETNTGNSFILGLSLVE
jgi:Flp pilus assembly protein TadG